MAQTHRYAQIGRVVATVLPLLSSLLGQHDLETELAIEDPLPSIATEQHVLKQVLLGILSYLIEHSQGAILRLSAHQSGEVMCLCAQVDPPGAIRPASPTEVQERLEAFSAMATLSGAEIQPLHSGQALVGFEMHFPIAQDTVLVVDDNADVLMLFQRYLEEQHYHVVTTQTAQEVSRLALQLQPRAITLDLMMPGQDGWELLQTLLHQPGTRHIPIVVCSVLKQKELALSLGATAFLEKPVTKQALLSVFNSLGKQSP